MSVASRLLEVTVSAGLLVGAFVGTSGDDAKPPPAGALRDGFEDPRPNWQREASDTTVNLVAHERSQRAAHDGRLSERFQFVAGLGSQFFVSYTTPQVPVTDDLSVSLYVRANRPGLRIYGRIVLPADVDPETKAPSFVLVPGTIFDQVDRWQRLELLNMVPEVERQARVLRVASRRPVPLKGAYLERVVVNLLGGPGESEVFLDDLTIQPVPQSLLDGLAKTRGRSNGASGGRAAAAKTPPGGLAVERFRLVRNLLEKRVGPSQYVPWFPTAIDAPGATPLKLRQAGFDVLVEDVKSDPERIRAALQQGALLMARLADAAAADGSQRVRDQIATYPLKDSVAFWHLGDHFGRDRDPKDREHELERARDAIAAVRGIDDRLSRVATATIDGELAKYARAPLGLDLLGIQPRIWCSTQNLLESYEYLMQRRLLTVRSNLGSSFWAWIPASAPPDIVRNVWGDDTPPAWGVPPVQPEQLRLMTYLALAAGYRGLVYQGNADLTRPAGRAAWIELSFLNLEIDLCEAILAENDKAIPSYLLYDPDPLPVPTNAIQLPTKRPPRKKEFTPREDLRAAAVPLRDRKGALLLVANFAGGAQFQPGQLSVDTVTLTPVLPEGAQAFQISPGDVQVLTPERVPGGTRLTLQEFDTTSLILCTGDLGLYERIRLLVEAVRPQAVALAIEQAELIYQAVTEINGRLAADGHDLIDAGVIQNRRKRGIEGKPPDVTDLFARSQEYIKNARDAQERQDYAQAWADARRALRPLRIVMSGHFNLAVATLNAAAGKDHPKPNADAEKAKGKSKADAAKSKDTKDAKVESKLPDNPPVLVSPASCPPAISFYTLPEFYIWVDWMGGKGGTYRWGENRVPSGTFNVPSAVTDAGWLDVSYQVEGLSSKITTVARTTTNANRADQNKPSVDELVAANVKSNRVIKMEVKPERPEDLDSLGPQFLDFPVAAIRSPRIRVETNNLVRISVLVKRPLPSVPGAGGIIVRDSIGGEQFQFRTSGPIATYSRIVLFRKAPADGVFTVMLGLAGYGEAFFDDFRVEVIERSRDTATKNLAKGQRPATTRSRTAALPDSTPPRAASRNTKDSRVEQR
jgi:hypothetical protein